jgi:error-prone DNA polymerase
VGLGYVAELGEAEAGELVAERDRGGSYESLADLAARSGVGQPGLERLAWAGACDRLATGGPARRAPLWSLGAAATAVPGRDGSQLALPVGAEPPADRFERPLLGELQPWERVVADYRSTGMTLAKHPMALLRDGLGAAVGSRAIERARDGSELETAGMVVARQRPATARGVVFMLLEDEWGVINLVIPPPVAKRNRLVVRAAGFVRAAGRLERREGVINLVVSRLAALSRPDLPAAQVKSIAPSVERETGRREGEEKVVALAERRAEAAAELAAALPAAHSFGRRGR